MNNHPKILSTLWRHGMALVLAYSGAVLAQPARDILPVPRPAFSGEIRASMAASTPMEYGTVRAPEAAPNIFLVMADDVGFSMSSTFGGPVPTPSMDQLARQGLRYNRFHTTGVCSPSRAALLTGRNAHRVGTGHISNLAAGYPGYNAHFPASAATIAQVLRLNGYSTAMFGKHHNIPPGQASSAGPFDMWPTGLGFEYFYGFPHGESDQIYPNVYRGTSLLPVPSDTPEFFEKRMADDAVRWLRNHVAAAPGKPFFVYYSPGSTHAPHQAPDDLIAQFEGRFDQGWDKVREETWKRQLAQGIIPADASLSPRPPEIAAWDSLSDIQRQYAQRGMEVAAAMMAYQDAQLGRVLDEMRRMGILHNTLVIVIQGDNGASGDGDTAGVTDEMIAMNAVAETEDDLRANIDRLGGEYSHGSYAEGWGWAMNSPFPWYKSHAGMLGALRDGTIVSWPGRVSSPGSVCDRFAHLVDIAPTLLQAAGLPAPKSVFGVEQMSLDGTSLLDSLDRCDPGPSRTQYFEVGGKAGLYSDGWMLSSASNTAGHFDPGNTRKSLDEPGNWLLYDLNSDFSQSREVAAEHPGKRDELHALWREAARANQVLPIRSGYLPMPADTDPRRDYVFWGGDVSIPAHPNGLMGLQLNRSFTLTAEFWLPEAGASGVVSAIGSRFAGWSLFLDNGRPVFVFARSILPRDTTRIVANDKLGAGDASLEMRFSTEGPGKSSRVEIHSAGRLLASGDIPANFVLPLGVGELFDAGRDTGVPVTEYAVPQGVLEGSIKRVLVRYD